MAKNRITTIKLSEETKKRLDNLKEQEKESYNHVINKSLNILNICLKNPMLANKILRDLNRGKKMEKMLENTDDIIKKRQNSVQKSAQ